MTGFRSLAFNYGAMPARSAATACLVAFARAFRPHPIHNLQPIDCVHEVETDEETPEQSQKQESRSGSKLPIRIATSEHSARQSRDNRKS